MTDYKTYHLSPGGQLVQSKDSRSRERQIKRLHLTYMCCVCGVVFVVVVGVCAL